MQLYREIRTATMVQPEQTSLGWLEVKGSHHDIGVHIGLKGRKPVVQHLLGSELWARVTAAEHQHLVSRLCVATQQQFPGIWDEIQGLAEGLQLPIEKVMAWNCRGEILASTPDGCTTIQQPGPVNTISHNEDGLPFFRHACFMVSAMPAGATGFQSFCYPGSLPGHSFAFNDSGLVQTVNNLRLRCSVPEIPRMILTRAVLGATTLEDAVKVVAVNPRSGGFNVTLAHQADRRIVSVEFGGGKCEVKEILKSSVHANHALYLKAPGQLITRSSSDRQLRGEKMLSSPDVDGLSILRDQSGNGLPVFRCDKNDPDCENTLASCVARLSENHLSWRVYEPGQTRPAYQKN